MSFGALIGNAISALNKGAAIGKFAHNTGAGLSEKIRIISAGKPVDIEGKSKRVANYQHGTVHAFRELCGAMGYHDPADLKPSDLFQRIDMELTHFDQLYTPIGEGQLLNGNIPETYAEDWQRASEESFRFSA